MKTRLLRTSLNDHDLYYHMYNDPTMKLFNVIIRDVPLNYTEELSAYFPIVDIKRLHNYENQPWPLISVHLTDNKKAREIFKFEFLFGAKVTVEPRRKKLTVIQCRRCLRFGHHLHVSGLRTPCNNCSGSHESISCESPLPTGAICGESHQAFDKACPIYIGLTSKLSAKYSAFLDNPIPNSIPNTQTKKEEGRG